MLHETEIAEALLEQIRRSRPTGTRVTVAKVEFGAHQSINQPALEAAWHALVAETELEQTLLQLTAMPWNLICRSCRNTWTSRDPLDICCVCGSEATISFESDDLRLLSIEVVPDTPRLYRAN